MNSQNYESTKALQIITGLSADQLADPRLHLRGGEDPAPGTPVADPSATVPPATPTPAPGTPAPGTPVADPAATVPPAAAPGVVPETYAPFVVPVDPETNEPLTALTPEMQTELSGLARELNLDQAGGQKAVDVFINKQAALAKQANNEFKEQVAEWGKASLADKEIGGENHQEKVSKIRDLVDHFSPPLVDKDGKAVLDGKGRAVSHLGALMDSSGLGSHPEFLRFMNRIVGELGEDTVLTPGGGSQDKELDTASKMYSDENMK